MIRIRFHGRGGHGIKTASRIHGRTAFISGYQVQDSPVYGRSVAGTRSPPMPGLTRSRSVARCSTLEECDPAVRLHAFLTATLSPHSGDASAQIKVPWRGQAGLVRHGLHLSRSG